MFDLPGHLIQEFKLLSSLFPINRRAFGLLNQSSNIKIFSWALASLYIFLKEISILPNQRSSLSMVVHFQHSQDRIIHLAPKGGIQKWARSSCIAKSFEASGLLLYRTYSLLSYLIYLFISLMFCIIFHSVTYAYFASYFIVLHTQKYTHIISLPGEGYYTKEMSG